MEPDTENERAETSDTEETSAPKPSWLGRNVIALSATSLLMDAHTHAVKSLLPAFMAQTLGMSKAQIGIVEGVGESSAAVSNWVSGWVSDLVRRRKPLAAAGYTISFFAKLALVLVKSFAGVLTVRLVDRLGKGVRSGPRDALLVEGIPETSRGRVFGFHRAFDQSGAVLGALVAYWLLNELAGNDRAVLAWVAIPGLLSVISILAFVKEHRGTPHADEDGEHAGHPPFPTGFRLLVAANALFFLGNISYAFFMLRAGATGTSAANVSLLYVLMQVAYSAGAYPAGRVADVVGSRAVLGTGYVLFGASCAGMLARTNPLLMWVWFGLYGLHRACVDTAAPAYTTTLVRPSARATALGILHSFTTLMGLPANVVAGLLWDRVGAGSTFAWGLALTAAAIVVLGLARPAAPGERR